MMGRRRGHNLPRTGHGSRFTRGTWISSVIPVNVGRRGAVRASCPKALKKGVVAVDVVPSRVHQAAVVQHARLPLGRFAERDPADLRTVARRAVEHEVGKIATTVLTADVGLQSSAHERESTVGKITRIEILDQRRLPAVGTAHRIAGRAGQTPQSGAVNVNLVNRKPSQFGGRLPVVAKREQHPPRLERQVWMQHRSDRQLALGQPSLPGIGFPRA